MKRFDHSGILLHLQLAQLITHSRCNSKVPPDDEFYRYCDNFIDNTVLNVSVIKHLCGMRYAFYYTSAGITGKIRTSRIKL